MFFGKLFLEFFQCSKTSPPKNNDCQISVAKVEFTVKAE